MKNMQIIRTTSELQQLADRERAAGLRIALVPTMGSLHEGHLSLVAKARARADRVWVSITARVIRTANQPRASEALRREAEKPFRSVPASESRDRPGSVAGTTGGSAREPLHRRLGSDLRQSRGRVLRG